MDDNTGINIGNTRGVIRRLDSLNRLTLPKEQLKNLGVTQNNEIEIFQISDSGFYLKVVK